MLKRVCFASYALKVSVARAWVRIAWFFEESAEIERWCAKRVPSAASTAMIAAASETKRLPTFDPNLRLTRSISRAFPSAPRLARGPHQYPCLVRLRFAASYAGRGRSSPDDNRQTFQLGPLRRDPPQTRGERCDRKRRDRSSARARAPSQCARSTHRPRRSSNRSADIRLDGRPRGRPGRARWRRPCTRPGSRGRAVQGVLRFLTIWRSRRRGARVAGRYLLEADRRISRCAMTVRKAWLAGQSAAAARGLGAGRRARRSRAAFRARTDLPAKAFRRPRPRFDSYRSMLPFRARPHTCSRQRRERDSRTRAPAPRDRPERCRAHEDLARW